MKSTKAKRSKAASRKARAAPRKSHPAAAGRKQKPLSKKSGSAPRKAKAIAKPQKQQQQQNRFTRKVPGRGFSGAPTGRFAKAPAKTLVYEEEGVIVRLNTTPAMQKHHGPEKREPVEHISVEDVKKAIHEAVGADLQDIDKEFIVRKQCIVCGGQAVYRIKARPSDTYCKDCALEYFKFLSYLEKI